VSSVGELKAVLGRSTQNVIVDLAPGHYCLDPESTDVEHGSCSDVVDVYAVAVGLTISGSRVRLVGSADSVIFTSAADYGVYIKDCVDCSIERITVRAVPRRNTPRYELGAGILVQRSTARISNCAIDNRLATEPVSGICVRGRSQATISFNEIMHSTSGIALLDDAHATVMNNLIDAHGSKLPGAGVLITCVADAVIERNLIRGSAFGIRMNGGSMKCENNVIENVAQDGILAMTPALGRVVIQENAIFGCGGSGISIRADGDQVVARNLVVETGTQCPRRSAISVDGIRAAAAVRRNTLYDNVVTDPTLDRDVPREIFWRARRPWTRTYRNTPVGVDGRHKFYESAFLTRYGRWAN